MRNRNRNWHAIALYTIALLFVGYMIVIPVAGMIVDRFTPVETTKQIEDMSLAEHVRLRAMEACTALYFFALGAAIGSFLNVVAYRAPRGESVTFRRSQCPSCGKPVRGRDNVPIVGWLLLRGRCRDCWAPISPRYLTAELVIAGLFLLLYLVELISGGANLPVRKPNHYHGVVWIVFYTKWDLVGLYLYHGFALCCLFTWALIDFDRQRIPAWLRWFVAAALVLPPAIWPELMPVAWWRTGLTAEVRPEWLRSTAVVTTLLGGLVGAVLGWVISRVIAKPERPSGHVVSASLIVGLSLGWQAVVGVWLIALVLRPVLLWAAGRLGFGDLPMTLVLLVSYLIQLLGWRLSSIAWWPSCKTSPAAWAVCGVVLLVLGVLNHAIPESTPRRREPPPEPTEPILAIDSEET